MKKSAHQKRLIAIVSDKGGVGKTTFAEITWERLLAAGVSARAFDLDGTTGSFASMYAAYDDSDELLTPQPADGVTPIFLHGEERDRDRIAEMLDTGVDVVLADMPATSLTVLRQVEADWSFAAAIADAGYAMTVVTVCTPFSASLANVNRSLDLFPGADHVVVLNEGFGDADDFVLWDGSPVDGIQPASALTRITALGPRGGVVAMPALNRRAAILSDNFFIRFAAAESDPRLRRPMQSRIATWRISVADATRNVDHLLGLAPASAEPTA